MYMVILSAGVRMMVGCVRLNDGRIKPLFPTPYRAVMLLLYYLFRRTRLRWDSSLYLHDFSMGILPLIHSPIMVLPVLFRLFPAVPSAY